MKSRLNNSLYNKGIRPKWKQQQRQQVPLCAPKKRVRVDKPEQKEREREKDAYYVYAAKRTGSLER